MKAEKKTFMSTEKQLNNNNNLKKTLHMVMFKKVKILEIL
ncbi:unnamed protein product [Larinioides sclopetarius]|uniref:Uncharacterized protein n=1 Tax=Larinioides sclopetarius TaxID=280406 RepID=A0AAV1Z8Y3_9ARAC